MFKVNCQSCGKPISKDADKGTEKSGSLSAIYCGHCYQGGQFTEPDITAEQMVEKVKAKLIEMKFPKFLANLFAKKIPNLKRWQANSH
jgi:hypothetical protein